MYEHFIDGKHVTFLQIQKTTTNTVYFCVACGWSPQTPFKNLPVLWGVVLGETSLTLWNTVYNKFLIILAFL